MIGYTNRFVASDERWNNHNDMSFHSCEHCQRYKEHCKKLERKLEHLKHAWSCGDYTRCESWEISK